MSKWSLTKSIIAINCLIAVWSLFLGPENPANWIKSYLPMAWIDLAAGQWWRLLTCSWVHADLIGTQTLHLFFNMMSLAMLGKIVEGSLGRRHFFLIYLPAGLLSTLFFLAEMYVRIHMLGQKVYATNTLLGASGCVMGLVCAFAVMHPSRRILIFPWPFPIRALTAALVFCGLSLLLIFVPVLDFIAHSAHLGGAIWGFLYMGLIGWYSNPGKPDPGLFSSQPEDLAPEIAMLEGLNRPQMERELPYILRKAKLLGASSLTRREWAFLQKIRNLPPS